MESKFYLTLACLFALCASAAAQTKYLIFFTDKAGTPYSVDAPEAFLSERAIERRTRQNIAVRERDLPVAPAYVAALDSVGADVWYTSRWFNAAYVQADSETFDAILSLPFVTGTQRLTAEEGERGGGRKRRQRGTQQVDTLSVADYGTSLNQNEQMETPEMHAQGFRGEGMLIGIFDSGFLNFDDLDVFSHLYETDRVVTTYDFVERDSMVYDQGSHGTVIMSTLAGLQPGNIVGTAFGASFALFRTEDVFSEFPVEEANWLIAAERADSMGVDLINSSLGYYTFDDASLDYTVDDLDGRTSIISRAATMAASTGILVVTSAGNNGNNSSWQGRITCPADADSIIAVAAVNDLGNRVGFSSMGPSADGRIKPDLAAKGGLVTYTTTGGSTSLGNGTSFSSPLLCGLAAAYWQANPMLTNQEVIDVLKQAGTQAENPDNLLGYGIPRFTVAQSITDLTAHVTRQIQLSTVLTATSPLVLRTTDDFSGQPLRWQVIDLTGRVVQARETTVTGGAQPLSVRATDLAEGVYVLRFTIGEQAQSVRFVRR